MKNTKGHQKINKVKRRMDISTLTGVSNWLTVLPIPELGFEFLSRNFGIQ